MNSHISKDFTLIDAFNQFWAAWEGNSEKRTLTIIGLYFYLVKQWNDSGRALQFRHRNNKICDELGISKPTLESARLWLKQKGLIDYFSKGKGDPNITYEIMQRSKNNLLPEVKKANNFTSDFTSHFTSDFTHNKENTENQNLYINIGKEVKFFNYLLDLLKVDEGLRRRWLDFGYNHETFDDGVYTFVSLKHGKEYKDFHDFRSNFFYWIPNYAFELKKRVSSKHANAETATQQKNGNNPLRKLIV